MAFKKLSAVVETPGPVPPDVVTEKDGWFITSYLGERIGRFYTRKQAEDMWRRWSNSFGAATPAPSFTRMAPRVTRKEEKET